jgi:hypothetical protein
MFRSCRFPYIKLSFVRLRRTLKLVAGAPLLSREASHHGSTAAADRQLHRDAQGWRGAILQGTLPAQGESDQRARPHRPARGVRKCMHCQCPRPERLISPVEAFTPTAVAVHSDIQLPEEFLAPDISPSLSHRSLCLSGSAQCKGGWVAWCAASLAAHHRRHPRKFPDRV